MAELTLLIRKAKRNNEIKIDLSGKDVQFIPNDLYGLAKAQIINLSNNRITSIDEKISQITNLKVLDLSNNLITELPKGILKAENLQVLILDENPLNKQFQLLLTKNASLDIKKALRVCFGLQGKEALSSPSWLAEDQKGMLNNSKAFGKMVEIQNRYETEANRAKALEEELNKLSMKEKKSNKQSFQLDLEAILEINFKDLAIFQQISMGGFSTIHSGQYKGLKIAVKKNFNPKITEDLIRQFSNQINMLAKFRHPNIVLLIGICSVPPNLAIVTQYIKNGSLYDLIHRRKATLKREDKTKIIKQILNSLRYLHGHDIVHRDIKSHNFLVDENLTVKLCDFGLAKHKKDLNQGPMQFSGTPVYMAQELFLKKSYDESVDIFAVGTLLYEVYTSDIPYNGMDGGDIKQKILKDSKLPLKGQVQKQTLNLINRCREMQNRPNAQQLCNYEGW